MLLVGVIGLFFLSFFWALWSLREQLQKPKQQEKFKNTLSEEKIIYHA